MQDGAHEDRRLLPAYIGDVIVPLLDGWKDFIMGDDPVESAGGDIRDTVPVLMGRVHFRDWSRRPPSTPDMWTAGSSTSRSYARWARRPGE